MSSTQPRGLPRCAIEAIMPAMQRPIFRVTVLHIPTPELFRIYLLSPCFHKPCFLYLLSRSRAHRHVFVFRSFSQHALTRKFARHNVSFTVNFINDRNFLKKLQVIYFSCILGQNAKIEIKISLAQQIYTCNIRTKRVFYVTITKSQSYARLTIISNKI